MADGNNQPLKTPDDGEVFVFPVSFAQQRLWFLDQFEPGSPFYNIPTAVKLSGNLDVDALIRSLNEIIRRHEALRTTFDSIDGAPVQIIHPHLIVEVPIFDLSHLPEEERQGEALRWAETEARKPFNLLTGPLLRMTLLRLSEEEHLVMLTMHHIISDGWSIGVFIYELSTLYAAFVSGQDSPLQTLPIQYADFSEWQHDWLQGEVLENQIAYWLKQLAGNIPVIELPADRPRPPVLTSRGAAYTETLPKSLLDDLKTLSQQNGATLFMTLLAAFQTLLYRYTGQVDVTVGSPIANRRQAELERLIGVFINTVVLRADLSASPTFRQFLKQVKEVTLGAYSNQDVPFEVIVDRLGLPRDMSHSPLFQVMFILQNAPVRAQHLPGIMLEPVDVHSGTSTFDLTLVVAEMADGLNLSVEYNTDLFNPGTIMRMVSHIHTLLESIVLDVDRSISILPLLSESERRLILKTWNETQDDFRSKDWLGSIADSHLAEEIDRRSLCVHQLIELQAYKNPDALAVVLPELVSKSAQEISVIRMEEMTYHELNERADLLAAHLEQYHVLPDQVVGVFMERSTDMIVALLGILKSGGAYLPLDPNAPWERLAFILADAGPLFPDQQPIILTQTHLIPRLPDLLARVIDLDHFWNTVKIGKDEQVQKTSKGAQAFTGNSRSASNNLVYLTYTSGSTGQSKGVMVEHGSLVNAYLAWESAYDLFTNNSHLQMANFTFDVFSGDLVRALCSGGKLVLCPREWLLAAERLFALIVAEQIDIAEFVPAVLRNLVQYLEKIDQRLTGIRLLACGSDSWYVGEYRQFKQFLAESTRLINSFGLTEATIDSTFFEGYTEDFSPDQLVPIGRPFANTKTYILDEQLQPQPVGISGELFIGGPGVARGYHNRLELNDERFIPNPFAERLPGDAQNQDFRFYKTGDLARYLPDGNIEFLGRLDDQVKIRGLRIEPGEIEAVLNSHPEIKEAAIVVVEITADDKRLAAYLVANHLHMLPTTGELRRYLQERLPDYMVPAAIVFIDALPLNPSGKIDRRMLSEAHGIDWSERQVINEFVPARTPTEEMLVDIWTQVLGVQQVGVFDNFFELGGHSLLATQLISRVRENFQVDLPLRNIFESPTVATLAENIDSTRLEFKQIPPLEALPRDLEYGLPLRPVPLSFAQQRLWFLDQLEPDSSFYNLPEAVRLVGPLDSRILEQALNEVIRRHESLRTTFQILDDRPVQVITPISALSRLSFNQVDLTAIPSEEREITALRIAAEDAQKPFNLATGPLLRGILIKLSEEEHIVILTMHHIIGDNWSSNVLIQDLSILYDAYINNRPTPLQGLAIQYADFAAWQRNWLQGDVLNAQLDYWKEQLKASPPVLELPVDRPRPAMQSFNGDYRTIVISSELSQKIRQISQTEGVTLFMTLLSAFYVLLHRYTGQEDISVGTPIANRTRAEVEGIIGFFVNTLVLRGNLFGEPGFREILKRVREMALAAYAHQDLPFEMVVEALQPERNLSHSPLFQVMFALQSTPRSAVTLPTSGIKLEPVEAHSGTSKFDLTLFMVDDSDHISGALEFNTDLFDSGTIVRMLEHFEILLNNLVDFPEQPVGTLQMLHEEERYRLLVEWNQTSAPFPDMLCAHQLFETQAALTPDAPAIAFLVENQENYWTYRELNERANQLAHYLIKCGIGPESLVGLCLDRSPEMVLGLLGVLKAGGAYIPLDPTYPVDRLAFMIRDAQCIVLLTKQRLGYLLSHENLTSSPPFDEQVSSFPQANPKIIFLDAGWEEISGKNKTNPTCNSQPDNLAYVIYTSGSTGLPKGAMILHRGLVNYLTWCKTAYPLEDGLGSPVHSSISFDLTITSLLSPLICGRIAFLLSEGLGVELLADALRREASSKRQPFSLIKITPAHLQLLGDQLLENEASHRTKAFIIGGENLTLDHIRNWQKNAPDTALVNEYGPTETVVGCCVYWTPLGSDLKFRNGIIPIGRPIINTQLYILDRHLQPVPIGVPGELFIGGTGVGRGYLNRPELTAEKFIPNPFLAYQEYQDNSSGDSILPSLSPGKTLYRTGDLARYLPDGNIECLGRVDFQVKIRGFRVELGEIEAVLSQHPAIEEVVVWYWEEAGYKNLAAYLVPDQQFLQPAQSGDGNLPAYLSTELREYLQTRLPDYMIPSAFVLLHTLPLTPNGKVDRKALPRPDLSSIDLPGKYIAPRNPEEEIIAEVFQRVLRIEKVGVFDNFFDLGGHSLLATQVISRIRDVLQVDLPLRSLFETPTIAGLTDQAYLVRKTSQGATVPPILPIERDRQTGLPLQSAPLSFSQQRLWVLDQLIPDSPLYNIPTFVQVNGAIEVQALEYGFNRVVARHEALRTVFSQEAGKPVQVVLAPPSMGLPVIDLTLLPEDARLEQALQIAREEALKPFDLLNGPLVRLTLVRLSEETHFILLNTHHIVSDDWSLGIFIQEILFFYADFQRRVVNDSLVGAFEKNGAMRLSELTIQYPDFAAWQRNWLQGDVLNHQLEYWKNRLAGSMPLLELPTDRTRPPVQTFSGAQVTFELPPDLFQAIQRLCHQEGVTLFMALLSAFHTLLWRYTGQDEINIGTPIANRTRSEVENLIGFFVNTLVMRGDLSGNPSFRDLLRRTRETALQAYAHQDLPFEMLVDAINPERDMSYHPLFQVMFVHQNAPRTIESNLPGLSLQPLELYEGIARFDLTLTVVETQRNETTIIDGSMEYNTDLFDQATIERLVQHYLNLIREMIEQPDQPIGMAAMLSAQERLVILEQWSQAASEPIDMRCVHDLFELQVKIRPVDVAVIFTDVIDGHSETSLTYFDLNEKANLLAGFLNKSGVKRDALVGICVERSIDMVIGLLGILKSGGAYLPLDPQYPVDRLAYMLEDSGADVLLTHAELLDRLPVALEDSGCHVICLDRDWKTIVEHETRQNPENEIRAEDLAYVIYTSGSTGRPKGVMLQHAGLMNLVQQQIRGFGVDAHSRVLQFASFSFDASVSEIFMALLSGGRLVLAPSEVLTSMPDLLTVMHTQAITTVTLPPSLLRVLDSSTVTQMLPAFQTLISAGEACPKEIGASWAVARTMFNAYGPTEATIGPTFYEIRVTENSKGNGMILEGVPEVCQTVPIGRPIPNMEVFILDQNQQLVPVGVSGEMYIGGIGLARGYLNQPDLTRDRFIEHPFKPGERLYRTGDLARFLPDGNIEYLDRVDFQVKVRGYRIELGEIEALLDKHAAVKAAIVLAREDRPGDKRLVAYILPEKEWNFDEPLSDTLKSYLRVLLPEYMLPSIFVPISEIPLTPNGKVDRRKLPAPDQSLLAVTTPYEAPRSSNEHILAELWAEVIGFTPSEERPTIGIHDNFFELGGDSILSIQVISRAAEAGLQLTPRQLFEYPTIAGLAALAVAGNQPEGNNISTSFSQASQSTEMNLDQVIEREMAEFGWNEEDITDILDAIQGAIGDDEQDPGEENMSELK